MIYTAIPQDGAIDQGDLIEHCPGVIISSLASGQALADFHFESRRVVVLTQTCDLANEKTAIVVVADAIDAQRFVEEGTSSPPTSRGRFAPAASGDSTSFQPTTAWDCPK